MIKWQDVKYFLMIYHCSSLPSSEMTRLLNFLTSILQSFSCLADDDLQQSCNILRNNISFEETEKRSHLLLHKLTNTSNFSLCEGLSNTIQILGCESHL